MSAHPKCRHPPILCVQDSRNGKRIDVELWMGELERQMKATIKETLRFALEAQVGHSAVERHRMCLTCRGFSLDCWNLKW